jgi:hypothetical protein
MVIAGLWKHEKGEICQPEHGTDRPATLTRTLSLKGEGTKKRLWAYQFRAWDNDLRAFRCFELPVTLLRFEDFLT